MSTIAAGRTSDWHGRQGPRLTGDYDSHDFHEGNRAFKEKRKPVYLGR